jgi:hypothetical protein
MPRQTLAEIVAAVRQTVACQLHNTREGRRLAELDPAALASVESQLVGNVAQLIDGLITDATGVES